MVKTTNGDIFGAFITAFPVYQMKKKFIGTQESFVFGTTKEDNQIPKVFYATGSNLYFMLCESESLTIGSEGDGPAIRLDKYLYEGSTNACKTYDSPILVLGGKKLENDEFKVDRFELYVFWTL